MKKTAYTLVFTIIAMIVIVGCGCLYVFVSVSPSDITFGFVSNTKDTLELKSMLSSMKILINEESYNTDTDDIRYYVNVVVAEEDNYVYKTTSSISSYEKRKEKKENDIRYKSYGLLTTFSDDLFGYDDDNETVTFVFDSGKKIDVQFDTHLYIENIECEGDHRFLDKDNFKVSSSAGEEVTFFVHKYSGDKWSPIVTIEIQ